MPKETNSVLYITHYSALLGANRSLLAILRSRKKSEKSDLVVVPQDGELTELLMAEGIAYMVLAVPLWFHIPSNRTSVVLKITRRCLNFLTLAKKWWQRRKSIQELAKMGANFDLIHTNSVLIDLGYWLSLRVNVPHVWHIREFADLDYHFRCDVSDEDRKRRLQSADQLVLVGSELSNHFDIEPGDRVTVLRNGVIDSAKAAQLKWSEDRAHLSLVIVGYLSQTKGQDIALKAFAKIKEIFPGASLTIVGAGEEAFRESLERLVVESGLEDVFFTGSVSDTSKYYLQSKYTLMCSKNEAMGRVTPEAMVHGSVVVGFKNGGTAEMITDGRNGVLYEGDELQIVERIVALESDSVRYESIRKIAREDALAMYTNEAYTRRIEELYSKVGGRSGK